MVARLRPRVRHCGLDISFWNTLRKCPDPRARLAIPFVPGKVLHQTVEKLRYLGVRDGVVSMLCGVYQGSQFPRFESHGTLQRLAQVLDHALDLVGNLWRCMSTSR